MKIKRATNGWIIETKQNTWVYRNGYEALRDMVNGLIPLSSEDALLIS